jgi:hypothetical protein
VFSGTHLYTVKDSNFCSARGAVVIKEPGIKLKKKKKKKKKEKKKKRKRSEGGE